MDAATVMMWKQEALGLKQDLAHLVEFYEEFQRYVEELADVVAGQSHVTEALERRQRSLQLALRDEHEHRFREWHNGEELLTGSVVRLIESPVADAEVFKKDLEGAVSKFEHLIRRGERELRNIHERIALLEGEDVAKSITTLEPVVALSSEPSLGARLEQADRIADAGVKWGGRIVKFFPWAYLILKSHGWAP
jgi:hypothetical protein